MTDRATDALELEARVFTAFLIDGRPTPYVVTAYRRAHEHLPLAASRTFDRLLVTLARAHPLLTRVTDGYARLFARRSVLRRKLALILAILESSPPADASFAPIVAPAEWVLARLVMSGLGFVVAASVGTLLIGPVHVVLFATGDRA